MTPVCTLGYINRPGTPAEEIILADLQQKHGGRIPAALLQWIRLPGPARCPVMPNYKHADGIKLERIAKSPEGYYLYAAYDIPALRVFWMVVDRPKKRKGEGNG